MKTCQKCKIPKALEEFYTDNSSKDKKQQKCILCVKDYAVKKKQARADMGFKMRKFLNDEEKALALKLYEEGISSREIAKKIGTNKTTILRLLKLNSVKIKPVVRYRKYEFKNEHYFDDIDSEDKAYFLGLLWADGCNFRKDEKRKNAYQVSISLQEGDKHIIEELCHKIYQDTSVLNYVIKNNSDGVNRQNQWKLRVPSKHISDILLDKGMTPRKSFSCEWPKSLPEYLDVHFIRGVYDGDGGIFFNNHSQNYGTSITGSVALIKKLILKVRNKFGQDFGNEENIKKNSSPMASFRLHGNLRCQTFLDWLYENSTVKLERKYKIYQELLKKNEARKIVPSLK